MSYYRNNELYHFGVKGMKWGVRRYQNKDGSLTAAGKKRQAKLERKEHKKLVKKSAEWDRNVRNNWSHAYNRAADKVNSKIQAFNDEWDKKGVNWNDQKSESYRSYVKAYCDMWNDIYTKELDSTFGKRPIDNGRKWCETVPMFNDPADMFD